MFVCLNIPVFVVRLFEASCQTSSVWADHVTPEGDTHLNGLLSLFSDLDNPHNQLTGMFQVMAR